MTAGTLVLMGSGELAPTMLSVHRTALADRRPVIVVDTPFGFQENADLLTDRIVDFFRTSLRVGAEVARLRTSAVDDRERLRALSMIRSAGYLFTGPGSPTYALEVWRSTGADRAIGDCLDSGNTVVLASAAALTAGTHTLPVYEIYKSGRAPYWERGIDLTSRHGMPMVVVPHWDNQEGGNHDTSRCYIGERRLRSLSAELPHGILGIDEHTAAILDFGTGVMTVEGRSGATLRGAGDDVRVEAGRRMSLAQVHEVLGGTPATTESAGGRQPAPASLDSALEAGDIDGAIDRVLDAIPHDLEAARTMVVELGSVAERGIGDPRERVGGFVDLLLDERRRARSSGDYAMSDRIRDGLAELGVEVRDTRHGVEWDLDESPD